MFCGKIFSWDVVNEQIMRRPSGHGRLSAPAERPHHWLQSGGAPPIPWTIRFKVGGFQDESGPGSATNPEELDRAAAHAGCYRSSALSHALGQAYGFTPDELDARADVSIEP
jgi:hypothetical protein